MGQMRVARRPIGATQRRVERLAIDEARELLERRQVAIYFGAVAAAAALAFLFPGLTALEAATNPALALMLFATFLQVPLAALGRAFARWRFMAALLAANFLAIPAFVAALSPLLPPDPMIRLGASLVLLAPCVDYVVTFAHLGRGDARALLAATPALLLAQMALLPLYLKLLLNDEAAAVAQAGPFLHAFLWLIAMPLALAGGVQFWSGRSARGAKATRLLSVLPIPATALALFVIVAAVTPRLGHALDAVQAVIPFYVGFAVVAPLIGLGAAKLFGLPAREARSVAFSAATRNSLVVLPLALAAPGAVPVLPAVIVAQTLVELLSELVYVRVIPRLAQDDA
ncbi:arsenic resistance protein [Methylocystis sp. 9N]|uniref:Arsenic resistance protein n=1 Tax=Methylocystis borbori TaxID=3118750 RepID=A0ABU7XEN4_9HYPH